LIGTAGLAVFAWLAWLAGAAVAAPPEPGPAGDPVALLPLDAERSLEIYGQPVASEIARALIAGHIPVVVVGPRMAVPERARLIIDGTIARGRAGAVTISLRLRNPLDGTVLETVSATAPGLGKIDSAAAVLSNRILPVIRDRLAADRPLAASTKPGANPGPTGSPSAAPAAAPTAAIADRDRDRGSELRTRSAPEGVVLIAVTAGGPARASALVAALDTAAADWVRAHHRRPGILKPGNPDSAAVARSVASAGAELAVALSVLDYTVEPAGEGSAAALAMARARVRVQIAGPRSLVFDRVVVTDTVLGDRGLDPPALAGRVAREVLAIVRPHLQRSVPSW
jgi:hypothetical protein